VVGWGARVDWARAGTIDRRSAAEGEL